MGMKMWSSEGEIFKEPFPEGSIVTIIHDGYSSAWMIGFAILKKELSEGRFAIISSYTLPLPSLFRAAKQVGLEIEEELEMNNLVVIDIFGSKYSARYERKNVFYIDNVSPETINPKINMIYNQIKPVAGERRILRVMHTLDGAALMFGEVETLKLLNQTVAERSKDMSNSVLVLLINRDVVSKKFVGWVAEISDYVIVASVQLEESIKEKIYVVKSPEEGFTSAVYHLQITEERSPNRIRIRKANENKSPQS